jgi:hypothetical protein
MTDYATHRFSVGLEVTRAGETPTSWHIIALIDGSQGPEYRIKSGRSEMVVRERELTYRSESKTARRPAFVVH